MAKYKFTADFEAQLIDVMQRTGESLGNIRAISGVTTEAGEYSGAAFTIWSRNWVYFPLYCEDTFRIGYAPILPCNIAMRPQCATDSAVRVEWSRAQLRRYWPRIAVEKRLKA